jgi:transketolase
MKLTRQAVEKLEEKARDLRVNILKMLYHAGSGHTGGSLSAIDVLLALFSCRLKLGGDGFYKRDHFVLSKGHAAPALYAVLAEKGYFPEEKLWTLRKLGSSLQGHPDMHETPGVEVNTGSLGQGLSVACGIALAMKSEGSPYRVYALLGDGECQEGQVWEAATCAAHYGLTNLCAIVDKNGLQIDGRTRDVMNIDPLGARFRAFGWAVVPVQGHSFPSLLRGFAKADTIHDRPQVLIAKTIKGKGVSFMENNADWHGIAPKKEQFDKAIEELQRQPAKKKRR